VIVGGIWSTAAAAHFLLVATDWVIFVKGGGDGVWERMGIGIWGFGEIIYVADSCEDKHASVIVEISLSMRNRTRRIVGLTTRSLHEPLFGQRL